MTRPQLLDLYFVEARHKLIDLGAFLDRVARAAGDDDFPRRNPLEFLSQCPKFTIELPHSSS
jgi:hypothetical protein